jgi:hypothetical protein
MYQYLTPVDIANNVRMIRTTHQGTILIVEGDIDVRVYSKFIDEKLCVLTPAFGKDNAIEALSNLEKSKLTNILVIIDSDFWQLAGITPTSSNLVLTDSHDLETMIINSEAVEAMLSEFGKTSKISRLSKPLREFLIDCALPIGFLRWLSSPHKFHLYLKFDGLCFNRFVDKKTLRIDINKLIRETKINSKNRSLNENWIKSEIIKLYKMGYDPWHVCSGDDLIEILALGLSNIFGNERSRQMTPNALEGILRIAYSYSCFSRTQLYRSITNWEMINPGSKVLK